ncbi:MAG: hypothetical protein AABX52_02225 [Nanoarchaeota archaeon]
MIKNTEYITYPFQDLDCDDIHALMIQTLMRGQRYGESKPRFQTYC